MAEYSNLSATINAQIRANGVQAITGPVLNAVLTAMVNVLGDGYRLAGVAHPADNPGSPDNRVAYLAAEDGTYTNFGGLAVSGEVALLLWDSAWTKATLFSIDTAVTPGSGNLVTSGAVDSALTTLVNNIAAAYMQLVPGATEGNLAEFDNAGQVRDAGLATSDLATKDGHYPDLFAGFAGNLVDTRSAGTRQGPFAFRQSGGDGVNYMRKILGRTEAWNQLVQGGDVEQSNDTADPRATSSIVFIMGSSDFFVVGSTAQTGEVAAIGSVETSGAASVMASGSQTNIYLFSVGNVIAGHKYLVKFFVSANDITTIGGYKNKNRQVFDLTLMFGAGNEPATVAEFEALHPLPYYAYNAGVLKNNAATGLETTGFNQWDEEWRIGDYTSQGVFTPSGSAVCSKNPIPIFENTSYYVKVPNGGYVYFYDAEMNFISESHSFTGPFSVTTPTNAKYANFNCSSSYGTTYNHDICINISDASRNGIYEPYWKRDIVLGLTGVTGIPEGGTGADRVTIFPNGLAGVGTAQDMFYVENGVTKAKKRAGSVDLGDLNWSYSSYGVAYYFEAGISGLVSGNSFGISSKYVRDTQHDDVISMVDNSFILVNGYIYVKDSTYNDAATFKTAMSGVKLCYELATPVVYTDLQNADGTPFVFPKMAEVDNLGTEKRLPEDTADNPQGPFECDSNYSVSTANLVRLLNL